MMDRHSVDKAAIDELAQVMKSLADPNRLRVFVLLMEGDSCNRELSKKLGLAPNLLSHHLRVLLKARLVSSRRDKVDGRWIYFAVNKEMATRHRRWLNRLFDPERKQPRPVLCGPEGLQKATLATKSLSEIEIP
jgi:ArsR family transcriptional regulator